jgi:hypothetical protein
VETRKFYLDRAKLFFPQHIPAITKRLVASIVSSPALGALPAPALAPSSSAPTPARKRAAVAGGPGTQAIHVSGGEGLGCGCVGVC